MNRPRASLSFIPFLLIIGVTSIAHAQDSRDETRHDWSLGAGIVAPYGGLTSLGTLSLERALGDDFALIVSAGGTYQRSDGDSYASKLAFARLGVGARAFLTPPAGVRASAYGMLYGEYAYFDEALVGVSAELGGAVDAAISNNVGFRIGAGLFRAAHHQDFDGNSQIFAIAGILPQAELLATF